ncbi:hypothetical protein H0O03_04995 [Candidatus Micrarchaeota archaeon]|nr:hypothetical protein [Candidatus Micrarchaeota archaeon]
MNADDLSTLLIGFLLLVFILVELQGATTASALIGAPAILAGGIGITLIALGNALAAGLGFLLSFGFVGIVALFVVLLLLKDGFVGAFGSAHVLAVLAFITVLLLAL